MYKNRVVTEMRKDFTENMINCNRISLSFCRNRNILIRGVQSIMRLLAPLL
jgi:cardiolipin synthase